MLLLKQNKFGQFLGSIEGINTKTLSIRLHELEDFGIIKRTIIKSRPVQTEYSLTDKYGIRTHLGSNSCFFCKI